LSSHIWLLHHLFLPAIRAEAELWRQVWNEHKMQLKGERDQSPCEMFFFGSIINGPRGLNAVRESRDERIDDPEDYGVDWEAYNDRNIMNSFHVDNPEGHEDSFRPQNLSVVDVVPPNCPLTAPELSYLDMLLDQQVDLASSSMDIRRLIWVTALRICVDLLDSREYRMAREQH